MQGEIRNNTLMKNVGVTLFKREAEESVVKLTFL